MITFSGVTQAHDYCTLTFDKNDPLIAIESCIIPLNFFLGGINVELTIKSMQRQLLQIADKLPDDITLTLLKSFAKILSREPEPSRAGPFIRAFAKIRDENGDKQFSAIMEEDEHQLKEYDSGNEVETFNFKVTTNTEEVVYSVGSNEQDAEKQFEAIANAAESSNSNDLNELQNGLEGSSNQDNSENIDEGIEVEMPKLLETDQAGTEDQIGEAAESNQDAQDIVETVLEGDQEIVVGDEAEVEIPIEEPTETFEVEEERVIREPTPTEPPKVSLDDIQREIHEMQSFLAHKGIKPEEKPKKKEQVNGHADDAIVNSRSIEDAYQVDVCIKLNKNKNHSHKKHHHSKYLRSENYKEEITADGPIFDPTVPNTEEDFMKVKSVNERIQKKKQKVQPLDVSWQNLVENQKRNYK